MDDIEIPIASPEELADFSVPFEAIEEDPGLLRRIMAQHGVAIVTGAADADECAALEREHAADLFACVDMKRAHKAGGTFARTVRAATRTGIDPHRWPLASLDALDASGWGKGTH